MTLFSDIINLQSGMAQISDINDRLKIRIGLVTEIRDDKAIRVKPIYDQTETVTYWLSPTAMMYRYAKHLEVGHQVLYFFVEGLDTKGFYFDLTNLEFFNDIDKQTGSGLSSKNH